MSDHMDNPDLKIAFQVLHKELEGLAAIKQSLDTSFLQVIDILFKTTGRVITMGIGKSGLIAKKFAATLASMGTPAMFIHPIEALHGDLGMITQQDAIICLSNSGESDELIHVIEYCKRFGIHTIGMCRNSTSSMVNTCDISLVLPNIAEASIIPAPTTSTTMMLAMSDIIAVVLAERKGFTHADFKLFHPGGSLGAQLTRLKDIMHTDEEMPLTTEDASMADVIIEISKKRFGCVGVMDDQGNLIGIITDGDIRRHIEQDYPKLRAIEIMTTAPTAFAPELFAAEALYIMNSKKITNCFIVADKKPIGIIHIHDLLKAKVA